MAAYINTVNPWELTAIASILISCLFLDHSLVQKLSTLPMTTVGNLCDYLAPNREPEPFICSPQTYTTQIISTSPLMIYITNFTTPSEAAAIVATGAPALIRSPVSSSSHEPAPSARTSRSAPLDSAHPAVACVLSRARAFAGAVLGPKDTMGAAQMVRYAAAGEKFDLHTDWFTRPRVLDQDRVSGRRRLYNRVATFFVVLECHGCPEGGAGETWFPHIEAPKGLEGLATENKRSGATAWREHQDGGIAFRPVPGNALFWVNIHANGSGDARTLHAGLPVAQGSVKTALNIWPRTFFGPDA